MSRISPRQAWSRWLATGFTLLGAGCIEALASPESGDALRARLAAAAPGETVTVAAGTYDGFFVIDRPLRLIGEPGAVLRGDETTHVLAIRAPDVEVAGFTVQGSGRNLSQDHAAIHVTAPRAVIRHNRILNMLHGVYVRKAEGARIEGNFILGDGAITPAADPMTGALKPGESELCDLESPTDRRGNGIHLWNSAGHVITGNTIRGTRDGIYFSFTDGTFVSGNTITQVRYGLHYMYSDENTFERNQFSDNSAGAALMYSQRLVLRENRFSANRSHRAYGLLLQSVDDTRIEENTISGNTLGLYLENSNRNTVRGNVISRNYVGLRVSDSTADSVFTENTLAGNVHPVETDGRNTANTWALDGRGNRWEGAANLDLNHDGIADLPHREVDLFGPWRRSFPAIGLLSASPGERLLRFVYTRLALPGLPGVRDPHPLATSIPTQP